MHKVKHDTYNDGFIHYGKIKTIRNEKREKIGEELEEIDKLRFSKVSIRNSDNMYAEAMGYTIDEKIKVPYRKLPNNIKVKLNNENTIYDVVKMDSSDKKNLYIYLQVANN